MLGCVRIDQPLEYELSSFALKHGQVDGSVHWFIEFQLSDVS
jgi:hypothetical protein